MSVTAVDGLKREAVWQGEEQAKDGAKMTVGSSAWRRARLSVDSQQCCSSLHHRLISPFCFPLFHQTFICITILPRAGEGGIPQWKMLIIFSPYPGFHSPPCFNFPRAHQVNIRPGSRRAAFTEQIRPQPPVFLPTHKLLAHLQSWPPQFLPR